MMYKLNTKLLLAGSLIAGLMIISGPSRSAESNDPIKLTLHDWTGQLITTHIYGRGVKGMEGTMSSLVQADYIAQFAGLKTGDLHVAMEMWETTGRDAMDEATATGKVENIGTTGMEGIEEWWYPLYMKERCPGLPDWKALNDCTEEFSTPETAPMGRYIGAAGNLGRI